MNQTTEAKDKTDNELIAEFMGLPLTKQEYLFHVGTKTVPYMKWRYHESWDWLMPVVEKIYKLNPRAFDIDKEIGPLSPLAELHIYDNIDVIYKAVVDFIKWYNANQPKS